MNKHEALVWAAIDIMHTRYTPGIRKNLARQDAAGTVTVTVNLEELALLKTLVSDKLGNLHSEWYDATHDETETDAEDLAYTLRGISARDTMFCRLLDRLNNKERED